MRVVWQGSVPPMISIAIGMHAAARRESQWQVKILREVGPRVVARVCDCNPVPQNSNDNTRRFKRRSGKSDCSRSKLTRSAPSDVRARILSLTVRAHRYPHRISLLVVRCRCAFLPVHEVCLRFTACIISVFDSDSVNHDSMDVCRA